MESILNLNEDTKPTTCFVFGWTNHQR
jgi:hypothetical protein